MPKLLFLQYGCCGCSLRGVAPPSVKTMDIYRGIIPFVVIQILGLVMLALFPQMATWLPQVLFG